MFLDRKEIQINHIDDSDEYLAGIMEQISARVIEHEPAPAQLDVEARREAAYKAANERHQLLISASGDGFNDGSDDDG